MRENHNRNGLGKTLLCVDDDPATLDIRRQLLELEGFQVIAATGAAEGLNIFRTQHVDGVILDYQMPGMNGGQLAAEMKILRPGIPVMIVSALPWLPDDAPSCIDAFISKADPNSTLMDKIADLVA